VHITNKKLGQVRSYTETQHSSTKFGEEREREITQYHSKESPHTAAQTEAVLVNTSIWIHHIVVLKIIWTEAATHSPHNNFLFFFPLLAFFLYFATFAEILSLSVYSALVSFHTTFLINPCFCHVCEMSNTHCTSAPSSTKEPPRPLQLLASATGHVKLCYWISEDQNQKHMKTPPRTTSSLVLQNSPNWRWLLALL
jgi:hypothetical protein